MTVIKCALWAEPLYDMDATDDGFMAWGFQVAIAGSNGYNKIAAVSVRESTYIMVILLLCCLGLLAARGLNSLVWFVFKSVWKFCLVLWAAAFRFPFLAMLHHRHKLHDRLE